MPAGELVEVLEELRAAPERRVALAQRFDRLRQKLLVLVFDALVMPDGELRIAVLLGHLGRQHAGPHAARILVHGALYVLPGLLQIAGAQAFLGLLAIEVRDHLPQALAAGRLEAARVVDGARPVLLLLIDVDQVRQRLARVHAGPQDLVEQALGAIQQTGFHEVDAELQQRERALLVGEVGAGDEVLVDRDGAIDLATLAKQVAEREMRLDRLAVDLEHLDEDLDGLVGLLVEQVVDALEVVRGEAARRLAPVAPLLATRRQPAREGGDGQ